MSTQVVSLSLPAGNYLLLGSARLLGGSTAGSAECYIALGGQGGGVANVNLGAGPDRKVVSMIFSRTIGAPATASIYCGTTSGTTGMQADFVTLSAVKVGARHAQ